MNFSSHIDAISKDMKFALQEDKEILLETLWRSLERTKELLKISSLDFWLSQLENHSFGEIPTTFFGVGDAKRWWAEPPTSRRQLESHMDITSEFVLSYCNEDDICEAQGNYHYYYHIPTRTVFKESELGAVVGAPKIGDPKTEVRIALVSELPIDSSELYRTT